MKVERTYRATVQEMWDLWTTKDGFESWWGPQGFRADVHQLEGRLDGRLNYDMAADTPEMIEEMRRLGRPPSHPTHSRFSQFVPHERLEITSLMDFIPGVEPYENKILVEFFPAGEEVRMVVTLQGLHSAEFSAMQLEGFTSQLTKLDQHFSAR